MSVTKEMIGEAELAKSYISNSNLPEDQKLTYIRLLNITTEATNGISPDQKIQKMTESILLFAAATAKYLIGIDEKIDEAVAKASLARCEGCRAMKHVDDVEEKEHEEELLQKWKHENGIIDDPRQYRRDIGEDEDEISWSEVAKRVLLRPWVYIFLTLAVISPYGAQIVEKILNAYGR